LGGRSGRRLIGGICSFTPHSLLFVQKGLEVILFTTEGTEHAEKMIKDMFYLPCLLCGKKCFVDTISLYAAQNKFKFTGCESWAEAKGEPATTIGF